ncbi:hypothetical protein V5O48_006185 [Marasmius crinis-equi]|uniref:MYND-type domain-containing protein n=1 Tax=Marasmius crinis-equi TaxID=585013 RepID=A0ABR3FK69_9AGAR
MSRRSNAPSAADVIAKVRKLGKPPHTLDTQWPSEQVQTAISCIEILSKALQLGLRATLDQVQSHWNSVLDKWAIFFLVKVALSTNEPRTPDGVDLVELTLYHLPELLLPESVADTSRIKHLENLVLQTWFRVLQENHPSSKRWNTLVVDVIRPGVTAHLPVISLPSTSKHISDSDRSRILLHHLDRHIPRLPRMSHSELEDFNTFLSVLHAIDFLFPNPKLQPLNTIHALVSIVAVMHALLCQRKNFANTNISRVGQTERHIHRILYVCAHNVAIGGATPFRADKVLRGGFIQTIFKIPPILHALDMKYSVNERVVPGLIGIMNFVSQFMIYNAVLRAFMRSLAKIKNLEESQATLQAQYPQLWEAWDQAKRKAVAVYALRQKVKAQEGFCGYSKCPTAVSLDTHYFRCSGCSGMMYCSHRCAKLHWKAEHRRECIRDSSSEDPALHNDIQLWCHLVKTCLRSNSSYITSEVSRYVGSCTPPIHSVHGTDQVDSFTQDDHLIYSRLKHPAIYLDFSETVEGPFPVPKIVNTRTLASYAVRPKYKWGKQVMAGFFERWRNPVADHTHIVVFASFPNNARAVPIHSGPFDFPLEMDDGLMFGDDPGLGPRRKDKTYSVVDREEYL